MRAKVSPVRDLSLSELKWLPEKPEISRFLSAMNFAQVRRRAHACPTARRAPWRHPHGGAVDINRHRRSVGGNASRWRGIGGDAGNDTFAPPRGSSTSDQVEKLAA